MLFINIYFRTRGLLKLPRIGTAAQDMNNNFFMYSFMHENLFKIRVGDHIWDCTSWFATGLFLDNMKKLYNVAQETENC